MATAITTPFALSGEKDTVPATDGAGAVNWTSGWTSRYSLNAPAPERLPVDRKAMNYVDYVMSDAIREIQKQGVANWYVEHTPYAKNAQVFHVGKTWRSSIDMNGHTPGVGDAWVDVSISNVPTATEVEYGVIILGSNNDIIQGNGDKAVTAIAMNRVLTDQHMIGSFVGGGLSSYYPYRVIKVVSGTPITVNVQRFTESLGECNTVCLMLDKREMTGAAPTLTITASGAGSIVLKPAGSDPIELSDDANIAMLYITTMYINGAQVVTCNLQEWESI